MTNSVKTDNLTNSIGGGISLVESELTPGNPVIVAYEIIGAVPEPSSALLGCLGLSILALFRRRYVPASCG